ncbi:beta-glucan synthesis-associated protein-domain-containing protein [Pterulicium gracile]|uniref:Beta-glucan synthesis-associated protein-domain-containing protein n=1 Tax=Pterulicium gracile TaxID=1884261 RepID=A0A5C3Q851_9AGAR|nr:beta-glucan synthesis-associated protein-domain-containing protein [Pterula gracilis]
MPAREPRRTPHGAPLGSGTSPSSPMLVSRQNNVTTMRPVGVLNPSCSFPLKVSAVWDLSLRRRPGADDFLHDPKSGYTKRTGLSPRVITPLWVQCGYIEASIALPGENHIAGLWPAFRTLGNLGRAGYRATLEGTWPYSYDACDVGTLPNQTLNGLPLSASDRGKEHAFGALSYLQGQRLSRCTCDGEQHPGPKHRGGS